VRNGDRATSEVAAAVWVEHDFAWATIVGTGDDGGVGGGCGVELHATGGLTHCEAQKSRRERARGGDRRSGRIGWLVSPARRGRIVNGGIVDVGAEVVGPVARVTEGCSGFVWGDLHDVDPGGVVFVVVEDQRRGVKHGSADRGFPVVGFGVGNSGRWHGERGRGQCSRRSSASRSSLSALLFFLFCAADSFVMGTGEGAEKTAGDMNVRRKTRSKRVTDDGVNQESRDGV
jgi:hypothetical protein